MTKEFEKFCFGFDRIAEALNTGAAMMRPANNYPPFNISKPKDNWYRLELAVAGFHRDELDIEIGNGILIIRGSRREDLDSESEPTSYVWKGISSRPFERQFTVAEGVEVKEARYVNGILTVDLVCKTTKTNKVNIS